MNLPPVYIISLARSADRRASMRARLDAAGVEYEIVDAVDGETLDLDSLQHRMRPDLWRLHYRRQLNRGEIGCYLSHHNLWGKIIADNTPHAIVLEDDAVFDDDFFAVAGALPQVPWHWNLVLLGYMDCKHKPQVVCAISEARNLVRYVRPMARTLAYMVDLAGAKKLHKQHYEIAGPIDQVWHKYWKSDVAFYHVDPPMATVSDANSIIDAFSQRTAGGRGMLAPAEKIKRNAIHKYEKLRLQWYHRTHPPRRR